MKAIKCSKYGAPEVLHIVEVDKPIPKDNELLIKIAASVVSPADCAFRKGDPFLVRFFTGLTKPKYILGGEFAGEIVAIGKKVHLFQVGDHVIGSCGTDFGAYAEYKCLPESGALALKPANMTFSEAATISDGAITALPFLRDNGKIKAGQKVLINGASGAVGSYAVQIAKVYGAEVTGVCSTVNMEMVKSLGADHVIDYTKEDFSQSEKSYDIIFDAVGKSSYKQSKGTLAKHGIYLTTVPTLSIMIQMLWTKIFSTKKAAIAFTGLRSERKKVSDFLFLNHLIEEGRIRSVIDREYQFHDIVEAHRYVDTGHKKGNVPLMMGA